MFVDRHYSSIKLFDLLIRARKALDTAEGLAVCPSVPIAARSAWVAVADGHAEQIAIILRQLALAMVREGAGMIHAGNHRVGRHVFTPGSPASVGENRARAAK